MNEYIFRMPRDTPELTWAGLDAYMGGREERKIGTTVTLQRRESRWGGFADDCISVELYCTVIARLYKDGRVFFPHAGATDRHLATGSWLGKVAADNGLGYLGQENWVRYLYPRTPEIDVGRERVPIAGQAFQSRAS